MTRTCRPCLGEDIKVAIKTHVNNSEVNKVLEKIDTCPAPKKIKICGSTAKKTKAKKIRKIYYDPDKGPPPIPEGYEVTISDY